SYRSIFIRGRFDNVSTCGILLHLYAVAWTSVHQCDVVIFGFMHMLDMFDGLT
ncbi:hypothetical protein SK128_002622, partial [Halocaridina rubra]